LWWQLQLCVHLWVAQHVSHTLCGRRARRRRFRLPPSAKQQLPSKLRQQPLSKLRKNAAAQCVLLLARAMCACICSGLWCGVAARLWSCAATPVIAHRLRDASERKRASLVAQAHFKGRAALLLPLRPFKTKLLQQPRNQRITHASSTDERERERERLQTGVPKSKFR